MAVPGSIVAAGKLVTPGGDQGLTGSQGLTGPPGSAGSPGSPGPSGTPAWTLSSSSFVVPAVGATVVVTVNDPTWMTVGEVVWIQNANAAGTGAAPFKIQSIAGNSITLLNVSTSGQTLGDMTRAVYDTNSDGICDHAALADTAPWTGITGMPATFPPTPYVGSDSTNTNGYAITVASNFQLVTGVVVYFSVANTNTAGGISLNVNGTGTKLIQNRAAIALSTSELIGGKFHGAFYDGAGWRIFTPLVRLYGGTNPVNPTVECSGYDGVRCYASFTSASGAGFTLQHVADGIPIFFDIYNGTGAAMNYYLNVSGTSGSNLPVYFIWSNSTTGGTTPVRIDNSGTLPSLSAGFNMILMGSVSGGQVLLL